MNRQKSIEQIVDTAQWDIAIIGGGATGLGIAVDAAQRGLKTILVEQNDFAKGTSSKATKLVHGGVRYMAQGNIKLVREALKERAFMLRNAAHVCHVQDFIIPCYSIWDKLKYGVGLKVYDLLSGKYSLGKTKILNATSTQRLLNITDKKIKGGVLYKDGQFDDARLAIDLAQTASQLHATVINHCGAIGLLKNDDKITGVVIEDAFTKQIFNINAKIIVNATGVFVDHVLQMDDRQQAPIVAPSQGVHIVIDKKHFDTTHALMIPKTKDGRVLFAVPWHQSIVVGTTDTKVPDIKLEPRALKEEVDFILAHFNTYTQQQITTADINAVFVGLRPLVKKQDVKNTSALSRDHIILKSQSGLWTITGGKWTTYRKMAEDILNKIAVTKVWNGKQCATQTLSISGNTADAKTEFGNNEAAIITLQNAKPDLKEKLLPNLHYTWAHVVYSIEHEMACCVEDVLARRTRILFVNANAAIDLSPKVAEMLALALNKDKIWVDDQIESFKNIAISFFRYNS